MTKKEQHPGGVKLTAKTARTLAMQEFGTARGLTKSTSFVGVYFMEFGNLRIEICADTACIVVRVVLSHGTGSSVKYFDPDTLQENFKAIDELDEATLDVLAYDLHVDWYDYSYPIEVKRRTIRDSIQVHRRLGTKYAVEKALGAVYPGTKVEEWFEYGGDPYKFRVVIGATEAGITADRQAAVLDRVRFYKNLRSHLEAISYQIEKRTAVKVAAVHAIGQRVEVYPYLARNMESHGGFYCGGYTQYGRKLAVFPNK